MIVYYITCKDKKEAKNIAMHLVKKKLAACANMFPISSLYWWKGKIVDDKETALLLKTIDKNFEKIKKEVKKIHSYEVPCILKLGVKANKEFERWINENCN